MKRARPRLAALAGALFALHLGAAEEPAADARPIVWRIEHAKRVGDQMATVLGTPRAVTEDGRKALRFDGHGDGLILPQNPIRGWRAFTIEVLFKPDGDGPGAQRFVHLEDTQSNRALIETRVTPDRQWYLDTFLYPAPAKKGLVLIDKTKLHPCDRWYWAALVYDGTTMSHFVNGVKEQGGTIDFGPMGVGRTAVGVRLNEVFWFQGAIAEVRFHPRAVAPAELQHEADRAAVPALAR